MRNRLRSAKRLLALAKPPPWTFVVVPALTIVSSALSVLPPIFIGRMIDALTERSFAGAMLQLGAYAAVTASFGFIALADGYASSVFRETSSRNLRLRLLRKLDSVRFEALERLTPGEIGNRIAGDVDALSVQLRYALFPAFSGLCTLAATVAAMARADIRLAGIAIVFAIFTLLPMRLCAGPIATLQREHSEAHDELHGYLQEGATLSGLALLRNAHAAGIRFGRFLRIVERLNVLGVKQALVADGAGLASSLLGMLGPASVMAIGALLAVRGEMTVGTIVTVLIFQSRMAAPFNLLSSLQLTLTNLEVFERRLSDVLELPDETCGGKPFQSGDITFAHVGVQKGERRVLDGATLSIARGAHVALVGPSGAGKSTLATLLVRLADPAAGTVRIGGEDIRNVALRELRDAVALIPQDPLLFDVSFQENLTLLNPAARSEDVARTLRICCLDDVVARLPQGAATRVGQRGFRLSGGERQRLCLARALLAQPDVLVLDEALSGVDVATESRILTELRELFKDRTLVTITHRTEATLGFDRVVRIENGRVAEPVGA